ncbi:MAG TPA: GntR family transcriptional regulator [Kofleriaceae bacterium]|jgi:DNA-binding FadR family transcriptional regulator|nr:GntR family transcriptional regulator [Kofleriaceae bacterium]
MALPKTTEITAIDGVFETLLKNIVGGAYPSGTRLPAERELARQLGASRPTLREALRRLGEWDLVEPRRGSGVVVRPYRDWSIEVLAAYLRYGKPEIGQPGIVRMMLDVLAMRRAVVLEVVRLTAQRVPKGGTAAARAAMARAWSLRDQVGYAREDFEVMRAITEAAQFTPGLWLLNRLSAVWFDATATLRFAVRPPDDYVAVHTRFFDLLEAGEADTARTLMGEYLERHDAKLVGALGAP